MYGTVLKKFIRLGGIQYKFPEEKILTHLSLFLRIAKEHGENIVLNEHEKSEHRNILTTCMEQLIADGRLGVSYDALLLDEAQDYTIREIEIFRRLAKVLIAAADSRQKIFDDESSLPVLEGYMDNIVTLKHHYRNGLEICKAADAIMTGYQEHVPMIRHTSYVEAEYKSKVTPQGPLTLEQQVAAMLPQLKAQLLAYPNDLIGVLCVKKSDLEVVLNLLNQSDLAGEVTECHSNDFKDDCPIWVSTISSAKGLEFRALHILGIEKIVKTGHVQRRLAFTGVTRAKTSLTVYWDGRLPGYLDGAMRIFQSPAKVVTKDNLFGV